MEELKMIEELNKLSLEICYKLQLDPNLIVKKKRGTKPEVSMVYFIYLILKLEKMVEVGKEVQRDVSNLQDILDKYLKPILGNCNGAGNSWKYKLLLSIGLRKCTKCSEIKELDKFNTENGKFPANRPGPCIICRSEYNKQQYQLEHHKELIRQSQERNYIAIKTRNSEYRCRRIKRVPKWSESKAIREVYRMCPEGYHVDHVIPLQGKLVSGLHVLANLQYLEASDNIKKSNKFDIQ